MLVGTWQVVLCCVTNTLVVKRCGSRIWTNAFLCSMNPELSAAPHSCSLTATHTTHHIVLWWKWKPNHASVFHNKAFPFAAQNAISIAMVMPLSPRRPEPGDEECSKFLCILASSQVEKISFGIEGSDTRDCLLKRTYEVYLSEVSVIAATLPPVGRLWSDEIASDRVCRDDC